MDYKGNEKRLKKLIKEIKKQIKFNSDSVDILFREGDIFINEMDKDVKFEEMESGLRKQIKIYLYLSLQHFNPDESLNSILSKLKSEIKACI